MSAIEAPMPASGAPPPHKPGSVLIREITLHNLLSFGPDAEAVPLQALNVIIGPNGSGKSNFIDAISLLQAAPNALSSPISGGGSITEWMYKGNPQGDATIDSVVEYSRSGQPLRHVISFKEERQRLRLMDERIENPEPGPGKQDVFFYYRFQNGHPTASVSGKGRRLQLEDADLDASILSQRNAPETYPELTYLRQQYARIRIYRDWSFGRRSLAARPQASDLPNDLLAEDFSNLALLLSRFKVQPGVRSRLLDAIADFMEGVTGYEVLIQGGTVQLFLEEGEFAIPATRLSDGAIRYLCLLAILLHPSPPPLVCIEEPELGLHPDVIPGLVDLMVEASSRMQLVVTTQSDIVVDALTTRPESVLVAAKENGQTRLTRLDAHELQSWLDDYRLGQVWMKGAIGGTRW